MSKNAKNIIIDIGHPANVHLFKNLYKELESKGWSVIFSVLDKEVTIDLLRVYNLPFTVIGKNPQGLAGKILSVILLTWRFHIIVKRTKPFLVISRGSIHSTIVTSLKRIYHIVFSDTEVAGLINTFSNPLVDSILTCTAYQKNLGEKQIRYPGYHELAYLHPHVYKPDLAVLNTIGVQPGEKYAIVRFVAWNASHDIGHKGISSENKKLLVDQLSMYVKVFISSEDELPYDLQKYQIKIKPEQMHDALNYATLLIGEGATMASECAILGTPAIFLHNNHCGCIDEQVNFGLIYTYSESDTDQKLAIAKAVEIVQNENGKEQFAIKRDAMLAVKIDVTAFMVWFVENYPASVAEMRKSAFSFDKFK